MEEEVWTEHVEDTNAEELDENGAEDHETILPGDRNVGVLNRGDMAAIDRLVAYGYEYGL